MTAQPILPEPVLDQLGAAVRERFGSVAVGQVLGLPGEAAMSRGDLSAVDRLTRQGSGTETLIRLFLLGLPVPRAAAEAALRPLAVTDAEAAGLVEQVAGQVSAALDLRPYSEAGGPDWWVISDLGTDVRPGRLHSEHVLGIGSAALTLAQSHGPRPNPARAGRRHRLRRAGAAPVAARQCGHGERPQRAGAADGRRHGRAERRAVGPAAGLVAGAGRRRALRPDRVEPAVHRRPRLRSR